MSKSLNPDEEKAVREVVTDVARDFGSSDADAMMEVVLLAMAGNLSGLETLRSAHRRAQHGDPAFGSQQCLFCGYVDAAVYQLTTGRSLAEDYLLRPKVVG